jgi:uncharacterized protein YbjT (DUF2867 family)
VSAGRGSADASVAAAPAAAAGPRHRVAILAGATGLVGGLLLERLCTAPDYRRVIALARRPPALSDPKLDVRPATYEALDRMLADMAAPDHAPIDVFCCLGTTIKAAGSQAAFRRVDHDYVLALGRWAAGVGARRFLVVSALGAAAESRVFYNRIKGETERELATHGLGSLVILRPSLLDGERAESRPGERLMLLLTRPIRAWLPARIRPVRPGDVAVAMLQAARSPRPPALITSDEMQRAAG